MARDEILGQNEVDRIFLQSRSGDGAPLPAEPELRRYDFLRPSLPGGKALAVLEAAHAAFARSLRKTLSIQLRSPVEVGVRAVETVFFSDLTLSLGSPAASFVFPAGRHGEGAGILDWGLEPAISFVDRLLGGTGHAGSVRRPLTTIEQEILRRTTGAVLPHLAEAWKDLLPLGREVLSFEPNPRNSRIARPEERFQVGLFDLRGEGFSGVATVGLPQSRIALALGPETPPPPAAPSASPPRDVLTRSELRHSHLVLSARLPVVMMPLRAVRDLEVGQVIDTGHGHDVSAEITVNGRPLFRGALGQVRGQVGLHIVEKISIPAPDRPHHCKQGRIL